MPAAFHAANEVLASFAADAYSYERRIRRFEGAQLLRFRWYGTNNNGPDEEIFVERKTHHESWSGQSSTKERFVVPQRLVAPYMLLQRSAKDLLLEAAGFQPPVLPCKSAVASPTQVSPAEPPDAQEASAAANDAVQEAAAAFIAKNKKLKKAIALGEEIQDEIAEHQLQPMVRISLDTNLCMVKEYRPQRHDEASTNWCRLADELLGKPQTSPPQQQEEQQHPSRRGPQAAGVVHMGVSLFDSIRSSADNLLTPLARSFADQTHQGLTAAGPGKKRSLLSPADGAGLVSLDGDWEDISQTAAHRTFLWLKMEQELQMQQAPRPLCMNGDTEEGRPEGVIMQESHASSADSLRQRLVRRHIRTVRKIDPKTSFAGERTFLHYVQKGLYLAGASLACLETLSGDWGLVVALVLATACILLCCGAYAIYVNRCRRISQRVAKAGAANVRQAIDSQWGPLLAFGAAGLATALVLLLQVDINLKHVMKNERELHMAFPEEHRRHLSPQLSAHLTDL
ncbi:hypothetical protein Emag_005096 [Eimeria magna]